ncbi:MAG: hypothetical protein ACMXYF_03745 [Candidatus Woesearchaeota archaeon]
MNTIVMAVIAVLVLVILTSIIFNQMGGATEQINRCPAAGSCVEFVGADSCQEAGLPFTHGVANQYVCLTNGQVDNTQVCCVPGLGGN